MEIESTTTGTPAGVEAKSASELPVLPAEVIVEVCSFLEPKDLRRVHDVCSHWRMAALTYNLLERTQLRCYFPRLLLMTRKHSWQLG